MEMYTSLATGRRRAAGGNFPPPADIVAEPPLQSFSAPAAPTRSAGHVRVPRGSVALLERRERRGRSVRPWCSCGRLDCSAAVASHCKPRWGRAPLAPYDCSCSRSGPISFVVLDTYRWDCVPCLTPVLGRGEAVAVFNAATAAVGQLLRRFERAERVDRRGRACAFAGGRAWAY